MVMTLAGRQCLLRIQLAEVVDRVVSGYMLYAGPG